MKDFPFFKKKSGVNDEGIDGFDWNEAQPKWPLARVMNVSLAVISAVVWFFILFRLFSSGGSAYEEMILLNDKAGEIYPQKVSEVLRIYPATDESAGDGAVIFYPVYLEETQNFQFTVRIHRRTFPPGEGEMGYSFLLRESRGDGAQDYTVSYYKSEKKWGDTYFRLCFEGIELSEEKGYTLLIYPGEYEGKEGEYPAEDAAFRFVLFRSDTFCKRITPDEDVFYQVK